MILDQNQQKIIEAIENSKSTILAVSHDIHSHPELSNKEFFASDLLQNTLTSYGFQVESGYAGIPTAFCARKGTGKPRVAFLAEYDALPGIGHACGHNVIAATSLCAGIGLGAVIDQIGGEVWVIGTPAEETIGAKCLMVDGGYFNDIDAALMIHPHAGNYTTVHALALCPIRVAFRGKASHAAAAPWDGINALDAMINLFTSINCLRQQIRPDARIHGIITNGGLAPNIIPELSEGSFFIRAMTRSYLDLLISKFKACAEGAAIATGCSVEFIQDEPIFSNLITNDPLASRFTHYMENVLGAGEFMRAPDHFGSIDMGNVSHVVPAIHPLVDITNFEPFSPHTTEFLKAACSPLADQTIIRAGKGLALTAFDVLTQPDWLEEIKSHHRKAIGK